MSAQFHPNVQSQKPEFGLGLRASHFEDIIPGLPLRDPLVSWLEVVIENYLEKGGDNFRTLNRLRESFPFAFHGVSLNLGSSDPLDFSYLKRLKNKVDQLEPFAVSDHLCWTGVNGKNLHNLMPLPYTQEAIEHVVERVLRVQDYLKRPILIENVSSYIEYEFNEMQEWEFISEVVKRSNCAVLLDINNVYVSSVNHGFDPLLFLKGIRSESVQQIHLAGHTRDISEKGEAVLIDTHSTPVCPEVWKLYREYCKMSTKTIPTMIEWDEDIPSYERLKEELNTAKTIWTEVRKAAVPGFTPSSGVYSGIVTQEQFL